MKILVYHGKYGDEYWLANTPEQKITALKRLFTFLDSMGCYEGGKKILHRRERVTRQLLLAFSIVEHVANMRVGILWRLLKHDTSTTKIIRD